MRLLVGSADVRDFAVSWVGYIGGWCVICFGSTWGVLRQAGGFLGYVVGCVSSYFTCVSYVFGGCAPVSFTPGCAGYTVSCGLILFPSCFFRCDLRWGLVPITSDGLVFFVNILV